MSMSPLLDSRDWKGALVSMFLRPKGLGARERKLDLEIGTTNRLCLGIVQHTSDVTCVLTYDVRTLKMFCVCQSRKDFDRLVKRLRRSQSFASNPHFIPVILISMHSHELRRIMAHIIDECQNTGQMLGYWSRGTMALGDEADVTGLPQRLSHLMRRLVSLEYLCYGTSDAIDFLEDRLQTLSNEHHHSVGTELKEQVVFCKTALPNIRSIIKGEKEIVKSMVQTVSIPLATIAADPVSLV